MVYLNSDGDIIIPPKEHNNLHFLLLNADAHIITKKFLTDIDRKSRDLSSNLSYLIQKRRIHNGKLE